MTEKKYKNTIVQSELQLCEQIQAHLRIKYSTVFLHEDKVSEKHDAMFMA